MVGLDRDGGVLFTQSWDQIMHATWSAPRLVVLYVGRHGEECVVRLMPRSPSECDNWVRFLDAKDIHHFAPVVEQSIRGR
jgi:hypothetical protein